MYSGERVEAKVLAASPKARRERGLVVPSGRSIALAQMSSHRRLRRQPVNASGRLASTASGYSTLNASGILTFSAWFFASSSSSQTCSCATVGPGRRNLRRKRHKRPIC